MDFYVHIPEVHNYHDLGDYYLNQSGMVPVSYTHLLYLKEHYPDLFNRAATLEENAMPYLKTVKGLGRSYSWKEQFGKE